MVRNGSEFNEQKPFGKISLNIIRPFFFSQTGVIQLNLNKTQHGQNKFLYIYPGVKREACFDAPS